MTYLDWIHDEKQYILHLFTYHQPITLATLRIKAHGLNGYSGIPSDLSKQLTNDGLRIGSNSKTPKRTLRNHNASIDTMRVTYLLRASHYTPKIQFLGPKWKEAKSTSHLCLSTHHAKEMDGLGLGFEEGPNLYRIANMGWTGIPHTPFIFTWRCPSPFPLLRDED